MKIGVYVFVTPRNAVTIESSEHELPDECLQEIEPALDELRLEVVKKDLTTLFGAT